MSLDYSGRCVLHGVWNSNTNWCPECRAIVTTLGAGPVTANPDRAARIRDKAEKMLERFDGEFGGDVVWTTEQAWKIASKRVDELDRLEAAEREKEQP